MMRLVTGLVLSTVLVAGAETSSKTAVSMAPFQEQLLELAFSGVSEMPLRPHIKNRSRAQLKTARTCLELNSPDRAERFVNDIQNWQRWMGYADIAAYYAELGMQEKAEDFLAKVYPALEMSEDIRSGKVAASTENPLIDTLVDQRYQAVLTRVEEVRRMSRKTVGTVAPEGRYGEVNAAILNAEAMVENAADTAEAIQRLKPLTTHKNFEIAYFGFHALVHAVDQHYDAVNLNRILNEEIKPALTRVPVFMKIDLYQEFAAIAVKHNDIESVLPILTELESMVESLKSGPRYYVTEAARVLQLMIKAGQDEKASEEVDLLLAYYREHRELIVNMERAARVCAVAEVYGALGKTDVALELYEEAIAEGTFNPNSRPQADDLNRICCSLALNHIEPGNLLWERLNEMRNDLGTPW
ncbi:hypothetical protein [Pontiella agarivorans]|uniref:Tetratricopeptide repeat protein n=1 Tax=Pontiella agarivorans TaxID=3038953 RepID=A0ABU5N1E2_9BACT|nr:hypothetical protein [Pontiella agarivorans]MDZ8120181.1 hypothetical protein [Pontiella agarivorans]